MRSWALACVVQLVCGACSSEQGGQTGGEDPSVGGSSMGGSAGNGSAGNNSAGNGSAGRAGDSGVGGGKPELPCPGGSVTFQFEQAPGSNQQSRCIQQCGWVSLLMNGVPVALRDEASCPPSYYLISPAASGYFDGRLPSGQCLAPGNYVARMCSSEIQAGTFPPPDSDSDPGGPSDAPVQPSCVPGAQKCVDVPFTYPTPNVVSGTLVP